jgi:hypothetical protein
MCRLAPPTLLVLSTLACGGPGEPFPDDYETRFREARVPCQISHDHELRYVRVFASETAYDPYVEGTGAFPPGASLIKAEYDDPACTELLSYVLMVKQPAGSTSADLHDWSWQRFGPDRSPVDDPREIPFVCVDCHDFHCREAPYGNDYTCTPGAPEPPPRM